MGLGVKIFLQTALRMVPFAILEAWNNLLQVEWVNIRDMLYCPCVFCIKLSILLQYLRIFVPNRMGKMATFISIHALIWGCLAAYSVYFILALTQCQPREKIWNPFIPQGHCINTRAAYLSNGILNAATDFAILVLPMPSLWKLQMPIARKISATIVFSAGSL